MTGNIFFLHFVQDREIVKPGASSQTRGRMIRTKWRRERKKIHVQIELTYYQSFSKDSGPQQRKGQYGSDFRIPPHLGALVLRCRGPWSAVWH